MAANRSTSSTRSASKARPARPAKQTSSVRPAGAEARREETAAVTTDRGESVTDVATPEVPVQEQETGEKAMQHAIDSRASAGVPESRGHDFAEHATNPEDVDGPVLRTRRETEANKERLGTTDFAEHAVNPEETHTRRGAGEHHDFAQRAINPEEVNTRRRA